MFHLHDARFHVERWMAEHGIERVQILAHVERHARVSLQRVPIHVIIFDLAFGGDLRRRGLQLLEAHDVGPIALQPLAQLSGARANAIDVPRRDFHVRIIRP